MAVLTVKMVYYQQNVPQHFYLLDILVYVNSVKINFGHLACIVQCLLYLLFVGGRPGNSLRF